MRDAISQSTAQSPRRGVIGGRLAFAVFLMVYGATVAITLAPSEWLRTRAPLSATVAP